jgi:large subunit ribosomal protein L20
MAYGTGRVRPNLHPSQKSMSRVKRGKVRRRSHRSTIASTEGFRGKVQTWRVANQRLMKSRSHAYVGRKQKKRVHRRLWITRINAGLVRERRNYAEFQYRADRGHVRLNRKTLSQLTTGDARTFTALVKNLVQS